MARQIYTARLLRKLCISERVQCFHLEFAVEDIETFTFAAGQFVSMQATDASGKTQTRAYSIASASSGNRFDLCLNRVEDGFFSNLLCDLEPGQAVQFHGPHGLFLLRQPLSDTILVATGTGVAPMRSFAQHLFPDERQEGGQDRNRGRDVWLVYGTRYESEIYYREYFEELAAKHENFHYVATLSRAADDWRGHRGYVQEHAEAIARDLEMRRAANPETGNVVTAAEPGGFSMHAYICGLNEMVSATRERLMGLGWHRKQIIFERYD
ncbi:MAG TPA: FAD-dependent oxidoreductase [Acidisarcina sp.]